VVLSVSVQIESLVLVVVLVLVIGDRAVEDEDRVLRVANPRSVARVATTLDTYHFAKWAA
jgi:hypothetical protein